MPKKFVNKLNVVALDSQGNEMSDEYLPVEEAFQRFMDLVNLHLTIGFETCRVIRLVSGNHVLYEFRDIRRIVHQRSTLDYFSQYLKS